MVLPIIIIILLLIGLAFLAICAVFIYTMMKTGSGLPDSPTTEPNKTIPAHTQFTPGTRPLSIRLKGKAYRYQRRQTVSYGENFYKVFIDGQWKWKEQQRFAGVLKVPLPSQSTEPKEYKINTGHYFALTGTCAKAEITHYLNESSLHDYALMQVEGELDDILDLTNLETIQAVADAVHIEGNIWDILKELISADTGGSEIPSYFGYYAHKQGYKGILFFSARAISDLDAATMRESAYHDEVMEDYVKGLVLEEMQRRLDRTCLVVFSGSVVTRSIQRYRYDNSPWEANPYYAVDETELDKRWGEYDAGYQASQGRVVLMPKREDSDNTP